MRSTVSFESLIVYFRSASILFKYKPDLFNAICIHGNLIVGSQNASELADAIKFRLREKLRRNGRKPCEEARGRSTKEKKENRNASAAVHEC